MPTAKVRIGNDVRLVWALYSADQPLSFDNCSEIEVELYCSRKQLTIKPDYTISGNKIIILFPAISQQTIGIWDARLRYKQPSLADPDTLLTYTHNTCAVFELVECSSEANDIGTDYVDEQGNRITISSVYISWIASPRPTSGYSSKPEITPINGSRSFARTLQRPIR